MMVKRLSVSSSKGVLAYLIGTNFGWFDGLILEFLRGFRLELWPSAKLNFSKDYFQ